MCLTPDGPRPCDSKTVCDSCDRIFLVADIHSTGECPMCDDGTCHPIDTYPAAQAQPRRCDRCGTRLTQPECPYCDADGCAKGQPIEYPVV